MSLLLAAISQHLGHIFRISAVSAVLANMYTMSPFSGACACMHAGAACSCFQSFFSRLPAHVPVLVRSNLNHGNSVLVTAVPEGGGTITASQYQEAMASVSFRPTERRAFMGKRNRLRGFILR